MCYGDPRILLLLGRRSTQVDAILSTLPLLLPSTPLFYFLFHSYMEPPALGPRKKALPFPCYALGLSLSNLTTHLGCDNGAFPLWLHDGASNLPCPGWPCQVASTLMSRSRSSYPPHTFYRVTMNCCLGYSCSRPTTLSPGPDQLRRSYDIVDSSTSFELQSTYAPFH